MSHAVQLTLFPIELYSIIVSNLTNRERKRLRLTCRTLRERTPLHINRVFLSANLRNVEVFRAIAEHETFRKGVTEIIWDDALLAKSVKKYNDEFYNERRGLVDDEGCPAWFVRSCNKNLEELFHRKGTNVDRLLQHVERATQSLFYQIS